MNNHLEGTMGKFTLSIDTNNAAFHDPREIGHVLERVAKNVTEALAESPGGVDNSGSILDTNGNVVGTWLHHPASYTHRVTLEVSILMEEMDSPSSEASAEIALGLVHEAIDGAILARVSVIDHEVVE